MDTGTKKTLTNIALMGGALLGVGYGVNRIAAMSSWVSANPKMAMAGGILAAGVVGYFAAQEYHSYLGRLSGSERPAQVAEQNDRNRRILQELQQNPSAQVSHEQFQSLPAELRARLTGADVAPGTLHRLIALHGAGTPAFQQAYQEALRQQQQQILEQAARSARGSIDMAGTANRPEASAQLEMAIGRQNNLGITANSSGARFAAIVNYLATLPQDRLNALIGMTTGAGDRSAIETHLAPMLGMVFRPPGAGSPGYWTSVGGPLTGESMDQQQIRRIVDMIIGPNDVADQRARLALIEQMQRTGVPSPNAGMVMGPNGQPLQVGGQALTQDRFRSMVSFGNWQPQQMGIEGLHDMLQNQAMRAPLDQELLDVQRRGFMELIRTMGSVESILDQIRTISGTMR